MWSLTAFLIFSQFQIKVNKAFILYERSYFDATPLRRAPFTVKNANMKKIEIKQNEVSQHPLCHL